MTKSNIYLSLTDFISSLYINNPISAEVDNVMVEWYILQYYIVYIINIICNLIFLSGYFTRYQLN